MRCDERRGMVGMHEEEDKSEIHSWPSMQAALRAVQKALRAFFDGAGANWTLTAQVLEHSVNLLCTRVLPPQRTLSLTGGSLDGRPITSVRRDAGVF